MHAFNFRVLKLFLFFLMLSQTSQKLAKVQHRINKTKYNQFYVTKFTVAAHHVLSAEFELRLSRDMTEIK